MDWVCISDDLPQLEVGRVSVTVWALLDTGRQVKAFYKYQSDEFGENGEWYNMQKHSDKTGQCVPIRQVVVAWRSL